MRAGAKIDVIRAERNAREFRIGVGVFGGQAAARKDADFAFGGGEAPGSDRECRGPRRWFELAGLGIAYKRAGQPVRLSGIREREAILVGDPLFVNLGIVARGLAAAEGKVGVLTGGRLTAEDAYALS